MDLRPAVPNISSTASPWMSILTRSVLVVSTVTLSVSVRENCIPALVILKVIGFVRPCDDDLPRGESPVIR